MKILIASLFFPKFNATHAGGRFVAELVRELSKRHEVHLATRIEDSELADLGGMQQYCRAVHAYPYRQAGKRGLFTSLRLLLSYLRFSRAVNRLVQAGGFDLVQVEWVEAGVLVRNRKGVAMVLDAHDVITKPAQRSVERQTGIRRMIASLVYRLVRTVEVRTMRQFDVIVARAEFDKQYVLSLRKDLPVVVIAHPAGLDLTGRRFEREPGTILFLASFKHRRTNVDAALYFFTKILPLVRKQVPHARFIIAGYGPPEELTTLSSRDPNVLVPGFVDDMEECYGKAAVFVAPILVGGGIIVKVLDGLASGTPVVTTSFGNEGIGAESGRHLIVADDAESFANAVISILEDREYADRLGRDGQEFIRRNYGKEAIFSKFEDLYRNLMKERQ